MKTLTIAQAEAAHPLAGAVLRQLGGGRDAVNSAIEAGQNGADVGWHGFTYYNETLAFAKRHRKAIAEAVEALSGALGEGAIECVGGFGCLQDTKPTVREVAVALYGGDEPDDGHDLSGTDMVRNALAWFALEEVGQAIADRQEEAA